MEAERAVARVARRSPVMLAAVAVLALSSQILEAESATIPLLEDFQASSNVFGFPLVGGPGITRDGNGTLAGRTEGSGWRRPFVSVPFTSASGWNNQTSGSASYNVSFWARVNELPPEMLANFVEVYGKVFFGAGSVHFGFSVDHTDHTITRACQNIAPGLRPTLGDWVRYSYEMRIDHGSPNTELRCTAHSANGTLLVEGVVFASGVHPIRLDVIPSPLTLSVELTSNEPAGFVSFDVAQFQFYATSTDPTTTLSSPTTTQHPTAPTTTESPRDLSGRPGVIFKDGDSVVRWESGAGLYLDPSQNINSNARLLVQGVDLLAEIEQLRALVQNCTCA